MIYILDAMQIITLLWLFLLDQKSHEASFQLTGLDAIRQKIAAACKWTPAVERVAPAGRGTGCLCR
jgi:hypothetical protein